MIISYTDLLNQAAEEMGFIDFKTAAKQMSPQELHKLYLRAIETSTRRGFVVGWNERSKRVFYSKKALEDDKQKEYGYIKQKLEAS